MLSDNEVFRFQPHRRNTYNTTVTLYRKNTAFILVTQLNQSVTLVIICHITLSARLLPFRGHFSRAQSRKKHSTLVIIIVSSRGGFTTFCGKKIVLGYFHYLVTIEYLRNSIHFKTDGVKRHPQIFDLRSSIFNSSPATVAESLPYPHCPCFSFFPHTDFQIPLTFPNKPFGPHRWP